MDSDTIQWPSDDTDNILRDMYILYEPYENDDPMNPDPQHPEHDVRIEATRERIKAMCNPTRWSAYTSQQKKKNYLKKSRPFYYEPQKK